MADNRDVIALDGSNGSITLSQESSVIYGSINHKITPKLVGSLVGQVQFSSYESGAYANDVDTLYTSTLRFSYTFNRYFSADIGNSFDCLNSSVPGRPYSRNRVYAGVTATY